MTPAEPVVTRTRRRWFQFSLRTLLIVMVLVAAACGWFASRLHQARRQAAVVDELSRLGVFIGYDYEVRVTRTGWLEHSKENKPPGPEWLGEWVGRVLSHVVRVHLDSFEGPDEVQAMVDLLPELPEIQEVIIGPPCHDVELSGHWFEQLTKLPNLRRLALYSGQEMEYLTDSHTVRKLDAADQPTLRFSSRSRESLAKLLHLERLDLLAMAMTDEDFRFLGTMQRLKELRFTFCGVNADRLRLLRSLSELESLHFEFENFTDDCVGALETLSNLRQLNVRGSRVTDQGVKYLLKLTSLRELDLTEACITDVALDEVVKLPAIEVLTVRGTEVTDSGIERLLQRRPGLQVIR